MISTITLQCFCAYSMFTLGTEQTLLSYSAKYIFNILPNQTFLDYKTVKVFQQEKYVMNFKSKCTHLNLIDPFYPKILISLNYIKIKIKAGLNVADI